jgi:arsenate reductase (glutaredoxin)
VKKPSGDACVIYHNPRCGKSRATLALLQEHAVEPLIVDYLKTPPTVAELKSLLVKLKLRPDELLRKGEAVYLTKLAGKKMTDRQLLAAMIADPILIERPIVVLGDRAVLGRPPDNVLKLLVK